MRKYNDESQGFLFEEQRQDAKNRKPLKPRAKKVRGSQEILNDIQAQNNRYQTADRCGNGLGMQKALIEIEKLEKELEANE